MRYVTFCWTPAAGTNIIDLNEGVASFHLQAKTITNYCNALLQFGCKHVLMNLFLNERHFLHAL